MDHLSVATIRGLVDALLELEDPPLDVFPAEVFPFIHRLKGRAHNMFTPTCASTIELVVPTSAYPEAFPQALACWAIPPAPCMRLVPAPPVTRRWRALGRLLRS